MLRVLGFDELEAAPIERFQSIAASAVHLGRGSGEANAYAVHLRPGGLIGDHEARFGQLFIVIDGEGWVSDEDGRCAVVKGEAVFIPRGTIHAKGTDSGLTAIMVQMFDMTVAPEVRLAGDADLGEVERCVEAAYTPYLERMARPPAPMLDDYARLIAEGVVRIALVDDAIVGVIVMWPKDDHFYIDNIAVDPMAQGNGVGSVLLDRAEREARATGRSEVRLYTNTVMTENLGYYPRRGFVETHRATEEGYERVYFSRPVGPAIGRHPDADREVDPGRP